MILGVNGDPMDNGVFEPENREVGNEPLQRLDTVGDPQRSPVLSQEKLNKGVGHASYDVDKEAKHSGQWWAGENAKTHADCNDQSAF